MKSTPIFLVFFGNRWGRGAFDEGHHEQVSLDGAFGEHVIITTGGGGWGQTHPSIEKIKEGEPFQDDEINTFFDYKGRYKPLIKRKNRFF